MNICGSSTLKLFTAWVAQPRSGQDEVLRLLHATQQSAEVASGGGRSSVAPATTMAGAGAGGASSISPQTARRAAAQRGGGCQKDRGHIDFAPGTGRLLEAILEEGELNEHAARAPESQCGATALQAPRRGEGSGGRRTGLRPGS